METLAHILIHGRNIPYLNTWPEDPSRLSAAIAYLNTCGSSNPPPPPPPAQLAYLLLKCCHEFHWDLVLLSISFCVIHTYDQAFSTKMSDLLHHIQTKCIVVDL